jgi:RNA polymerase sigma-70 factor (ECF subfamily)
VSPTRASEQDRQYLDAVAEYGPALDRLARGYEADADLRRDLRQEIHTALWRSLRRFDGRCSLRTWVYRVAHNAAATYVVRRRAKQTFVDLEEIEQAASGDDPEQSVLERDARQQLLRLVQGLGPADRLLTLLYLEDLDAAEIGEITGLSAPAVGVKIHRIKAVLARRFQQGGDDAR